MEGIRIACRVRQQPAGAEAHALRIVSPQAVEAAGQIFKFDAVFGPSSTQADVFAEAGQPVCDACLVGRNGSLIACIPAGPRTWVLRASQ